jgi:pilus assembly protein Flp/PilA
MIQNRGRMVRLDCGLSFRRGGCRVSNCNKGFFQMRNFITSFVRDESGAAAAEYALILAIVGAGIVAAVSLLGTNISTAINNAAGQV